MILLVELIGFQNSCASWELLKLFNSNVMLSRDAMYLEIYFIMISKNGDKNPLQVNEKNVNTQYVNMHNTLWSLTLLARKMENLTQQLKRVKGGWLFSSLITDMTSFHVPPNRAYFHSMGVSKQKQKSLYLQSMTKSSRQCLGHVRLITRQFPLLK